MGDEIHIENLEIQSRIGVTAEERAEAQQLTVSLTLETKRGFQQLDDRIENTVDYAAVCERVKGLAAVGERNLIETLAEEIASLVLREFAVRRVAVELRKYVLPETEFVAVKVARASCP